MFLTLDDYRGVCDEYELKQITQNEETRLTAEAAALARTLGQVWQASPTAGLYAITADADFEAHFGKKAAKRRKIYNGMIPCQIYMYFDRPVKPVRK